MELLAILAALLLFRSLEAAPAKEGAAPAQEGAAPIEEIEAASLKKLGAAVLVIENGEGPKNEVLQNIGRHDSEDFELVDTEEVGTVERIFKVCYSAVCTG